MYKNIFRVFINLPLILYILIMLFLSLFIGLTVLLDRVLIQIIILLGISINLCLERKKYNIIGIVFITINLIYNIIIGYYDSLTNVKFNTLNGSIYITIGLTMYYLVIYIFKKCLEKNIKNRNK